MEELIAQMERNIKGLSEGQVTFGAGYRQAVQDMKKFIASSTKRYPTEMDINNHEPEKWQTGDMIGFNDHSEPASALNGNNDADRQKRIDADMYGYKPSHSDDYDNMIRQVEPRRGKG